MQNGDEALPTISTVGRGQLVEMIITFELSVYFDQILHTYTFKHWLDTGMQNGDEASPSIGFVGRGQLVKMLIPLEPCGILIKFD